MQTLPPAKNLPETIQLYSQNFAIQLIICEEEKYFGVGAGANRWGRW